MWNIQTEKAICNENPLSLVPEGKITLKKELHLFKDVVNYNDFNYGTKLL